MKVTIADKITHCNNVAIKVKSTNANIMQVMIISLILLFVMTSPSLAVDEVIVNEVAKEVSTDATPEKTVAKKAVANDAIADEEIVKGIAKPWQSYYQGAATPVMERVQSLHNYIFVIISVITVFVTALLIYVCIRFHHKRNPNASKTTHNTLLEIAWITIPALILVTIFIPSLKLHYYMDKTHNPDLTLKITGYQWYWGYSYPDQEVEEYLSNIKTDKERSATEPRLLSVDNPLVVPVGATVRVLLTGADVIHSFAMPSFGVKTDCIPGRLNETWFQATKTGIYYGQCSELCGQKHGFMPIEVRVVEKDVFKQWVERAKKGDFALNGINIPTDNKVAAIKK